MIARYRHPDVDYVIDKLIDLGVISEDGCSRLAEVFRGLEVLSGVSERALRNRVHRRSTTHQMAAEKEEGAAESDQTPRVTEGEDARSTPTRRRRGPKLKLQISEEELREAYRTKTAKEIADQYGVSVPTVTNRLREFGIQKESGKRRRRARQPVAVETEENGANPGERCEDVSEIPLVWGEGGEPEDEAPEEKAREGVEA